MNPPKHSKINLTALAIAIIGLAVKLEWIPPEYERLVIEITFALGSTLLFVFRTWFTAKKAAG